MNERFQISRDTQALYITAVAKDRLPVFRSDALKTVVGDAIDEARNNGGFLLFADVIMPDHVHLLTNQLTTVSDVLRRVKGTVGHHVVEYLKENNFQTSLEKLRHEEWKRKHSYSVWQVEKNVLSIFPKRCLCRK